MSARASSAERKLYHEGAPLRCRRRRGKTGGRATGGRFTISDLSEPGSRALRGACVALCLLAGGCREEAPREAATPAPPPAAATSGAPATPAPEEAPADIVLGVEPSPPRAAPEAPAWIVAGGGSVPADNQLSIEDDLADAARIFGGEGVVLFAGGPGSHGVQVLDPEPRGDPLKVRLAEIFAPRAGRDSHYRPVRIDADGPATASGVLDALQAALLAGSAPLTVYLAGHGDPGEVPGDVMLVLWGARGIVPADLAALLDAAPARPVRLVITSCYSGAFAELAFVAADSSSGPAEPGLRCGLFASTWDRPSSGCDPNPDRRRREGYGAHFLGALEGRDPGGKPLPPGAADFDGDGAVSLLEAHSRARIASRGLDVPTTTSERWLRHVAPAEDTEADIPLPEEDAVIAALGDRLALPPRAAAVRAVLDALDGRVRTIDKELVEAQADEADRADELASELLARWPVLDDPWHPDHPATMAHEGPAIKAFLQGSEAWSAYARARDRVDALAERRDQLDVAVAAHLRLSRALDNRTFARRLAARGGPELDTYLRLLGCERGLPP